jgi:phage repressor protein C with HTH and peptisase S24 domain
MEPQFDSGDKVLIEYCTDIRNGDIGCFYVSGIGGVIKQKAYDRLHSLNPKCDDIIVHEDGATVIGRVLGTITKDMIPTSEEKAMYMEAVSEKGKHPEWFE